MARPEAHGTDSNDTQGGGELQRWLREWRTAACVWGMQQATKTKETRRQTSNPERDPEEI
ncbi:hypothetical protein Dimus_033486, partial [Dionaea muscipula]